MATIRLHDITVHRNSPAPGTSMVGRALGTSTRRFSIEHQNLTVPHGRTMVILGPSGCGKTTLLRIISGLEQPDEGKVLFNGQDVHDIPPGERQIGMLFQSYALYPHFTSKQNITSWFMFRKRTRELDELERTKFQRTSELLDVDISYLLDRRPSKLSGGEKQRVALGRCITREPQLFLLDEPFSNLDAKLRVKYRLHLKTLLKEFSITTVYVTHDQTEAVLLADTIAVMRMEMENNTNRGWIEQTGTVKELYEHPASMHVADFLNFNADVPSISFLDGAAVAPGLEALTFGVRPEHVAMVSAAADAPEESPSPGLPATIRVVAPDALLQYSYLTLQSSAGEFIAKVHYSPDYREGQQVRACFRVIHAFDRHSGVRTDLPKELAQRLAPAA